MPRLIVLMLAAVCGTLVQAAETLDMRSVVAHNDIVYLAPARGGWEGLPLGNGNLGAQVWQPDSGFMVQLNSAWGGPYGCALARLRLRTAPDPWLAGMQAYTQRLALYDATLRTEIRYGRGALQATAFVAATDDVLAIRLGGLPAGQTVIVELEGWRPSMARASEAGILLLSDTAKGWQAPDYRYALAIAGDGAVLCDGSSPPVLRVSANGVVWAALAESRDPAVDVVAAAKAKLADVRKRGWDKLHAAHSEWWARFWDQSFISLSSPDETADYLANCWYLHLYAMGAGSRGPVPPKFNGGLWLDNYDVREWGPAYWHWNTQECYWPLYAANHLELLAPYYRMYGGMRAKVESQTLGYFGVAGAHFEETIAFDGGYSSGKGPKEMGVHPRLPVPKSFGATNMILSSGAEIAMQFWWNYLYTGDDVFLREQAYPLMKAVATFYVNYLEKDARGCYGIWPANAHETFLKVHNPTPDLAGIRYLFPALIQASTQLGTDADLRPVWQERLEHLAPYPLDLQTGGLRSYELQPGEKPVASNAENPDLFPVGVFPLLTLGSPDWELGVKTFRGRHNLNCYGWTTDSIAAARLGLAEELAKLLPDHLRQYQTHPSGLQDYYPRKPAIHPYLEGSGTFATAINEMLLQSWHGVVRIAPALPKQWSATFRLLAMGGFEITAQARQGAVTAVSVRSLRGGVLRLANPYPVPAAAWLGGTAVPSDSSDTHLLVIPTQAGKTYRIVPVGATPEEIRLALTPNAAPKHLPGTERGLGIAAGAVAGWLPAAEPNAPQPPAAAATPGTAAAVVQTPQLAATPVLDGDLSEAAWKDAATLDGFCLPGKAGRATQPTTVRVGHDAERLYLGITCWEARMASLIAEHPASERDRNLAMDDSVEIILQVAPQRRWRLTINALGSVFDARGPTAATEDPRFNLPFQAAVVRQSNRWIVELAIPFAALAPGAPGPDSAWGFSVCRNEKPFVETSTWPPVAADAAREPAPSGRLRFPHGPRPAVTQPLDPDLVGRWSGDDLAGNWVRDSSGNGLDAEVIGKAATADAKLGKGLALANGFLEVPDCPALNLTTGLTIMAWLKPAAAQSARIVDKGHPGANDAYMIDTLPRGNLRVITGRGGFVLDTVLPLNSWSHVALTYDGAALRLYLDGKLLQQVQASGPLSITDLPLHIGADAAGGSQFAGVMNDVMLWKRALSVEDIQKYMTQPPVRRQP